MTTVSGAIQVPDSGTADVGTRVGQLAGATVEAQIMVLVDAVDFDNQQTINSNGEIKFQSGNSVTQTQVTVNVTSTLLKAVTATQTELLVANGSDTEFLYVGATGVVTGDGFRIAPRATLRLNNFKGALYGLMPSTTTTCYILSVGE